MTNAHRPPRTVQLEMDIRVGPIPPGEHHTCTTRGPAMFRQSVHPSVEISDDGEIRLGQSSTVRGYANKTPNFPMMPYALTASPAKLDDIAVLESVQFCPGDDPAAWEEQLIPGGSVLLFHVCGVDYLPVAWPTFTEDAPLGFQFHNPMRRTLGEFWLTLVLKVPEDFEERWRA